jgi:hypothetical protein
MSNGLKKFFVLFFHILVTSAFGSTLLESELSKPISTLIEINSGALHSGLNSLCTQELFYKKENKKQSSSELYNKCAIDLCGPPEFNPTAWLTNANFSQNVSAFALKRTEKMIPLMDKMFNISLKRQKHLLIKMKALVAGPEKLLNAASSTENENMGSHFFPQFVKTTVNKSASLLERINISVSLPKDASIELALAVKNYADNLKLSMMNNASYTEFQQAYGEDDYSQLLAYHFKNLKNSLPKNTHAELIELDKLISEKKNFNRSEFFITLNKLKLLSQKYPLESKEVFKNSVCDIPECKMALVEFLTSSKTKDTIKLYEDQLNDPEVKNRAINQCRALIISESMRETDAKKAQLVFKAAVSNIKSSLLPTFSSHSRELLTAYLNKSLSASHKNYNNNNNRNPFVEFEESAKDFINFDKKVISFGNNNLPIEKILELHQDDSSSDLFNDVQPCQKMASNAWDSFLPAETMKKVFSPDESKKLNFTVTVILFLFLIFLVNITTMAYLMFLTR